MSFDDYEQSVASSTPVELYDFVTPSTTYRLTSFQSDVVFSGNTYTATTMSRSSQKVSSDEASDRDISIELQASHALVQQYAAGIPPRTVDVTVRRYQPSSGIAIFMWQGFVASLEFRGRIGAFRVPHWLDEAFERTCPSVVAKRTCNHALYDARCQIVRTDFDLAETVSAISTDGKTITVFSMPAPVNGQPWALFGELLHNASGERRGIVSLPGATSVGLAYPFPNGTISVGHAVTLFAGCDHTIKQCRDKFNNVLNFGGFPDLPKSNVFTTAIRATNNDSQKE